MYVNDWNDKKYIPFNQKNGQEYCRFLEERIKNKKRQLNVVKNKIIKAGSNEKKSLLTEKQKLEDIIDDDTHALKSLKLDLADDAELDRLGLFGASLLGKSIAAITQVVALPVAMSLRFAEKYPVVLGTMVLALQAYDALAAPVVNKTASTDIENNTDNKQPSVSITKKDYPIMVRRGCLRGYKLGENTSLQTLSYKVINICNKAVYGYAEPESAGRVKTFSLPKLGSETKLVFSDGRKPNFYETNKLRTYKERFCPRNVSPKTTINTAEKNATSLDNHHLAYIITPQGTCTGSFVSEKHVLTAAHCVVSRSTGYALEPSDFTVRVGSPSGRGFQVADGYFKTEYINTRNVERIGDDLAILQLAKAPAEAKPVNIVTADQFCQITKELDEVLKTDSGYPDVETRLWNKDTAVWKKGNAKTLGFGLKRNAQGEFFQPDQTQDTNLVIAAMQLDNEILVAYPPTGSNLSSCFGDSGAPVFVQKEDGKFVQLGVTVSGDRDCTYSNSVNLHHPAARKWIKMVLRGEANVANSGRLRLSCAKAEIYNDGWWNRMNNRKKIVLTNNCRIPVTVSLVYNGGNKQRTPTDIFFGEILEAGENKVIYTEDWIVPIFS